MIRLEVILDYLTTLGLGGIAIGMLLEALGLPCFPGGVMIILAGFLVNQGLLSFEAVLGTSFGGYTAGSVAAYLLGRNMSRPVARRLGRWLHFDPVRSLSRMPSSRVGGAFVLLGRFLPGLGNLTPYLAGAANLQWGWFMLYNSIFGLLWGTLYLLIGVFFGHNWPIIVDFLRPRLVGLAVLAFLLGTAVFLVYREHGALLKPRFDIRQTHRVPGNAEGCPSQKGGKNET